MLGIWLGFREFYTENQACGRNFLVLSVKDNPSVQYSKGTVICLSLVFYFILYTFPSAVWLVAQQNISVELKSKKNIQKGILYPERRRRREKDVSSCCFSQAPTKAMLEYQQGKLRSSHNNAYYLHVSVSFFFFLSFLIIKKAILIRTFSVIK